MNEDTKEFLLCYSIGLLALGIGIILLAEAISSPPPIRSLKTNIFVSLIPILFGWGVVYFSIPHIIKPNEGKAETVGLED